MNNQKIYAVMSGKGGVGKSTISCFLASILCKHGKTLIIDFDICGPSIADCIQIKGKVKNVKGGFLPIKYNDNLDVLSFGSILNQDDVVIWRGPKKLVFLEKLLAAAFLRNDQNELLYDYVVIDTPPGISDEHRFLIDRKLEVFIVTTSQNIALNDTQNSIEFCMDNKIEIKGVFQNMSFITCECCNEKTHIYGKNGGKLLSEEYEIPFLGELELINKIDKSNDHLFNLFDKTESFQNVENKISDSII
ncbi:hypothetical protein NUSPORA_01555 [Nucleospora cyclopteri]